MTDRDLVVRALAVGRPPDSPVTAVMTREVVVLEECTDLLAAAGQMASWACRRVPVVDHRGAVRGVVTVDDVALVLSELVDNLADRAYRGSTRAKRYVRRSAPLTAVIVTRSSRDA